MHEKSSVLQDYGTERFSTFILNPLGELRVAKIEKATDLRITEQGPKYILSPHVGGSLDKERRPFLSGDVPGLRILFREEKG